MCAVRKVKRHCRKLGASSQKYQQVGNHLNQISKHTELLKKKVEEKKKFSVETDERREGDSNERSSQKRPHALPKEILNIPPYLIEVVSEGHQFRHFRLP